MLFFVVEDGPPRKSMESARGAALSRAQSGGTGTRSPPLPAVAVSTPHGLGGSREKQHTHANANASREVGADASLESKVDELLELARAHTKSGMFLYLVSVCITWKKNTVEFSASVRDKTATRAHTSSRGHYFFCKSF